MCLLVPLIENPPWTRRTDAGEWQKLVNNSWETFAPEDLLTLTQTEGQVWIALFSFVCNNEIRKRYHFNSFRKGQLLRARKYINEVLLDQLPVLADVQRFMDELAITEVPEPTAMQGGSAVMMVEQVSVAREKITANRDWKSVAKHQIENVFGKQTDATDADLKRLVENVYALEGIEDVLGENQAPLAELYAQPLASLTVTVIDLSAAQTPNPARASIMYTKKGAEKVMTTQHGPFLRQKWTKTSATVDGVEVDAAALQSALSLSQLDKCMVKVDVSFEGDKAFQTALCSDPVSASPSE